MLGADTPEELEAVRVEVLGRKGALAEISKGMGKLVPDEKKRIGMLLNAVLFLGSALATGWSSSAPAAGD